MTVAALAVVVATVAPWLMTSATASTRQQDGTCKRVLVVGDSIARHVGADLEARLAARGLCADVMNEAVSGSSVVEWAPGERFGIDRVLARTEPDLVVAHFVGNEGESGLLWSEASWLQQTGFAALTIVDSVLASGADVAWALPPKGGWACDFEQLSAQRFVEWETWVHDDLWATKPVMRLDWRTPFGGEKFSRRVELDDGSTKTVRNVDCVHLTDAGAAIAADVSAADIAPEWDAA